MTPRSEHQKDLLECTARICYHIGPAFTRSVIRPFYKDVDNLSEHMLFHMISHLPYKAMYSIVYLWGGRLIDDTSVGAT